MNNINSSEYIYVMASTLNQMVNYIPLKYYNFKFKKIYNITIQDSRYFTNKKWDENLERVLNDEGFRDYTADNEEQNLIINQEDINNIDSIIEILEANFNNSKKVFWNITGGQRPIILAIQKFISKNNRKDDLICYLEGNNSKMVVFRDNEIIDESSYNLEDLKISTALQLMGFKINGQNSKEDKNYDTNKKDFYLDFLDKYIELIKSDKREELLKNLMILNKNYPSEKSKNSYEESIKKYERERKEAKEKIKKLLQLDKKYNNILEEELEAKKKDKSTKSFGYILEGLAGYKILDLAENKIADINFSEKINHLKQEDRVSEKEIDEFDIALLTKNGKFMIFECKSGSMSGDVAKSTKYSTYAVSGVYGLPILITPLLYKEIEALRKKTLPQEYQYLKDDLYKNIRQSTNSAIRAGLEVWGLDEIEEKIIKYIDLGKVWI